MQRQARLAEQRQQAAARQQLAAARRAEQAQRAAERARVAASRAREADRKRREREAIAAHVEAMQAVVESLNIGLAEQYAELDGLLEATLAVDDFVDLESLRVAAQHPPFPREDLRRPIPVPQPIPDPALPVRREVDAPKGLFGRRKKLAAAETEVEEQYAADCDAWKTATDALPGQRAAQVAEHAQAEQARLQALAAATELYEAESAEREREAAEQNEALDQLIAGLGYGTVEAVQEYVGIVLANSVYPEHFPVAHAAEFDPSTAELTLRVTIPGPDTVPTIKTYKYTRSTDEISETRLSQKDSKDRYAGIVHAVALRSLHEVFEADRRALIRSISLELGTETISPATGRETYVPFVAVAVDRESFSELDLSAIVPAATLQHLGAVVSKNPYGLVAIDSSGIRRL
jgi:restriction system protein